MGIPTSISIWIKNAFFLFSVAVLINNREKIKRSGKKPSCCITMFYLIGDIHGYLDRLISLTAVIGKELGEGDTVIFLGDYIDRGPWSYEVVEYLINFAGRHRTIFLSGNHEDMLKQFISRSEPFSPFLFNGGNETIRSYVRNRGSFDIPESHLDFYNNLLFYHEGEDFIAVHAGLNPKIDTIRDQTVHDMLWIRENFFNDARRWEKTVIFGHTPVLKMAPGRKVFSDPRRNIIGIDSGVIFGRELVCLRWPDRKIFSG